MELHAHIEAETHYAESLLLFIHRQHVHLLVISSCACQNVNAPQRLQDMLFMHDSLVSSPVPFCHFCRGNWRRSITSQHALDQITQRTPEVLASTGQTMFVNK